MGALHQGHLSLVEKSRSENDFTVVSIFVNPIQFNNSEDLEKYPRMPKKDFSLLQHAGCDAVFFPDVKEMYPETPQMPKNLDLSNLTTVLEGAFRPGHFEGVIIVVKKLFEIVNPSKAYFGEKDFQQLTVISAMVQALQLKVKVIGCPIIRENDGLAMSSRNLRLEPEERKIAPKIFAILNQGKKLAGNHSVEQVKQFVEDQILQIPEMKLEYFEIVNEQTLQPIRSWEEVSSCRFLIAVWLGKVRLIDNVQLFINFAPHAN